MWRNITKVLHTQDFCINGSSSCIGFSFGDGSRIRFWVDEWIEGFVLKVAFPRIFALLVNKLGKVNEFGFQSNNAWH